MERSEMPGSRIEADYLLETPDDPSRVAELMAGEQSSGTFVAVPGESEELKSRVAARVERLQIVDETVTAPSLPSARINIVPGARTSPCHGRSIHSALRFRTCWQRLRATCLN